MNEYSWENDGRTAIKEKKSIINKKLVVIISVICVVVLGKVIIISINKSSNYKKAEEYYNNGKYDEAEEVFYKLGKYKDSRERYYDIKEIVIKKARIGEIVEYGQYYNIDENNKSPIEWIVLENDGKQMIMVSRYALDVIPYNNENKKLAWEMCSLRDWLNGYFVDNAFNEKEKQFLITNELYNESNMIYRIYGGGITNDTAYILGNEISEKYSALSLNVCYPTRYALSKCDVVGDNGAVKWWIRLPGINNDYAVYMDAYGEVDYKGCTVETGSIAVRPVICIDLINMDFTD